MCKFYFGLHYAKIFIRLHSYPCGRGFIMKILIVTDIDNPGLKEDCMLAKAFVKDGHQVTISRQDYDPQMDEIFDVILLRNIWHLNSQNYLESKRNIVALKQRLLGKKIPTINLISQFDDKGKKYLIDLYNKGYPVIPTSENLDSFRDYQDDDKFLLKPVNGYDGYDIQELTKKEIKASKDYLIQPKMAFVKEVEFYFINKSFQYALEFVPSKKPIYPTPNLYNYTESELAIAQQFANLCAKDFNGVQRIDFLKLKDGQLLLLEIGDSAPYLNLNSLNTETREKFLTNYKNLVYSIVGKI